MEKQSVRLRPDQVFTIDEFREYINESVTDEDIVQMFEDTNLTKDSEEVQSHKVVMEISIYHITQQVPENN